MANTGVVTTGLLPLTIGSVESFEQQANLNSLPWDLTAGTVSLLMTDPNGTSYSYPATISGGCSQVTWTVVGPVGVWLRAWSTTDSNGIKQVSRPIPFIVASSPS